MKVMGRNAATLEWAEELGEVLQIVLRREASPPLPERSYCQEPVLPGALPLHAWSTYRGATLVEFAVGAYFERIPRWKAPGMARIWPEYDCYLPLPVPGSTYEPLFLRSPRPEVTAQDLLCVAWYAAEVEYLSFMRQVGSPANGRSIQALPAGAQNKWAELVAHFLVCPLAELEAALALTALIERSDHA